MNVPKEPTVDECSNNAMLFDNDNSIAYALWYPQMGGYVGKAVAVMCKSDGVCVDACIDVFVWHDGEFPFGDESPSCIHHCDPSQFITFGETLIRLASK